MQVSVIIPVFNGEKTIAKALLAILPQVRQVKGEVVVVDDGSNDKTHQIVRGFADINLVSQENAGPAAARNNGAEIALGEILIFTDSDCVPEKDWINKLLLGFDDPKIAVVAGSYAIANPDALLAQCIHGEIIYRHRMLLREFPKSFGSYNFAIRRKIFAELKGFNLAYRQASGEDNDLAYRVLKAGYKIRFDRNIQVAHFHTESVHKYLKEQLRHGFWRALLYRTHPKMSKGDDYTFWKDMVEVPWVILIAALLLINFLNFAHFSILGEWVAGLLMALFIFEVAWSRIMLKDFNKFLFFGGVLTLRAFFRTCGLLCGLFQFSPRKFTKKSK